MNGRKKVTVVGAGNVGATCAQELARRDYADVVLLDVKPNFAAGKALDINQAGSVLGYEPTVVGVDGSGYAATAGSDVVVITAGLPRKPGMSRDDLVKTNEAIVAEVTREIVKRSKKAVLVIVSNPLDAMCHVAKAVSKFPRERVVGMAGVLDTSRFECFIAQETGLSVKEVTATVLGGHGDQMVPVVSATTVGGIPLDQLVTRVEDQQDGRADEGRRRRAREAARHLGLVRPRRGRGADGRRDLPRREAHPARARPTSRASTGSRISTWAFPSGSAPAAPRRSSS